MPKTFSTLVLIVSNLAFIILLNDKCAVDREGIRITVNVLVCLAEHEMKHQFLALSARTPSLFYVVWRAVSVMKPALILYQQFADNSTFSNILNNFSSSGSKISLRSSTR